MSDADTKNRRDSPNGRAALVALEAFETTETYQTQAGVVFYSAENPLAWLQADVVVDLDEVA